MSETKRIAILSVYDKTGLFELVKGLTESGVQIYSSGGTASKIREFKFPVEDISSITKTPEMLGGRLKTLHPVVHGGILARDQSSDENDLFNNNIKKIDFVICNLYPFVETISKKNVTIDNAIDEIDIGGVTLLRAAAKNHSRVVVLSDPKDYSFFLEQLKKNQLSIELRSKYALKAFEMTAAYDSAISGYFRKQFSDTKQHLNLKYGVNPHQDNALVFSTHKKFPFKVLCGSPSYINILDALNSWPLVKELSESINLPAAASFKHVSPAGVGVAVPLSNIEKMSFMVNDFDNMSPLAIAYSRARSGDRMSSFGDFIALSEVVDECTARLIQKEVSDGIIAPGYSAEALNLLKSKKNGNYCILQVEKDYVPDPIENRQIYGVTLQQKRNEARFNSDSFKKIISKNKLILPETLRDLIIATITIKYTQSNSVCYAKNGMAIGIGAGQQSRIHCTRLAGEKANKWWLKQHPKTLNFKWKKNVKRSDKATIIDLFVNDELFVDLKFEKEYMLMVEELPSQFTSSEKLEWISLLDDVSLSSDAFFPFPDNIHRAAKSGVKYIYACLGSVSDDIVISTADSYNMVFIENPFRLFHH